MSTPAWQRKEGKNPNGGLNDKGRASAKKEGHDLKPPQPEGGSRKKSFCARMEGMKKKLTSEKTAHDPNSRINKSLRVWKCADGCAIRGNRKWRTLGALLFRRYRGRTPGEIRLFHRLQRNSGPQG